jgi:general stress protein 26
MPQRSFTFEFVEEQIRKKSFGILSTVSPSGSLQSTGILYGVSPPNSKFSIYMMTHKSYEKTRNIMKNSLFSVVIPFPHYYLRFVPSSYISLRGTATIMPFSDVEAQESFRQKRILRMNLATGERTNRETVFIKGTPDVRILSYGVGIGIMMLQKHPEEGSYAVTIPPERR